MLIFLGAADKYPKTGNNDDKVTLGETKAFLDHEMTYQARRRFSRDQNACQSLIAQSSHHRQPWPTRS